MNFGKKTLYRFFILLGVVLIFIAYEFIEIVQNRYEAPPTNTGDQTQQQQLDTVARVCSQPSSPDESREPYWNRPPSRGYYRVAYDELFKTHAFVDHNSKVLMCIVPQAEETAWEDFMKRLSQNSLNIVKAENEIIATSVTVSNLVQYQASDIVEILETYKKITFARNPLKRIVSVFQTYYVQGTPGGKYYNPADEALRIQRIYGGKTVEPETLKISDTKFDHFVQDIIDSQLSDNGPMNGHVEAASRLCQPCLVRYDFIGHYEDMQADGRKLLARLGESAGETQTPTKNGTTLSTHTVKSYLNSLEPGLRELLSLVYKQDMDIFGYDGLD